MHRCKVVWKPCDPHMTHGVRFTSSMADHVHRMASMHASSVVCATSGFIFCRQQGTQLDMIAFSSGTVKHNLDWEGNLSIKRRNKHHVLPYAPCYG
jgi:hypothetical protein